MKSKRCKVFISECEKTKIHIFSQYTSINLLNEKHHYSASYEQQLYLQDFVSFKRRRQQFKNPMILANEDLPSFLLLRWVGSLAFHMPEDGTDRSWKRSKNLIRKVNELYLHLDKAQLATLWSLEQKCATSENRWWDKWLTMYHKDKPKNHTKYLNIISQSYTEEYFLQHCITIPLWHIFNS